MNQKAILFAVLVHSFFLYAQTRGVVTVDASSETGLRRFEIGAQVTDMRVASCIGAQSPCRAPQFGLGAGASLNLNQHFALDAGFLVLPRSDSFHAYSPNGTAQGGRMVEFLAGPRAQVRARKYSFFADVRPGLVSWSQVLTSYAVSLNGAGAPTLSQSYARRTFFALETGGGIEYSPGARVHLRVDMGDLLIRNSTGVAGDYLGVATYDCASGSCHPWTNNLQTTAGVYWSLGKPIPWTPPDEHALPRHSFFDRANRSVIAVSLLGQAADAITTQRMIGHGLVEQDPFARPFVKYGWSGQVGLAVIVNAAQLSGMYALHRMHQHRIERILPLAIASASAAMAYRNDGNNDYSSAH